MTGGARFLSGVIRSSGIIIPTSYSEIFILSTPYIQITFELYKN
jgi:hypothetical protein